ncbi:MAG TPA: HD domain-containing protein [bacterium]|nr:HD domain-containing protein [bacterium]HQI47133.1 HD domain-containing protein [bacterium]HQJ63149.1 HD domain-containing protein [bacterium]
MKKKRPHFDVPILRAIGAVADHAGCAAYAVGGYVRDRLLGRTGKDIDIVVVGDGTAFAQQLADHLNIANISIFKKFGTAMLRYRGLSIEVVGARRESYRSDSRHPEVSSADLETDLARRDFTINALAVSLNGARYGEVIDPFAGRADLEAGILRTPLDAVRTFSDDPLRILRAIRFAAQLQFEIEPLTFQALGSERERLHIISQERISEELVKMIASRKPSIALRLLSDSGVLDLVLPEVAALKGVEQIASFRHKDVFEHTLKVVDNVAQVSDQLGLRFAALFHDIAKPQTKEFKPGTGWSFHGHEELGARLFPAIGRRLRLPQEMIDYIQKLIRLHLRPIHLAEEGVTDSAIRRLIFLGGADLDDLITLCRADITSGNAGRVARHLANFDIVVKRMQEVEERDRLRAFQPPVRGDEIMSTLGLAPGPMVGTIKKALEEAILDGLIPNEHDAAFAYMLQVKDRLLTGQTE